MPGFIIHLAITNRFLEKHKNEIKDKNKFSEGSLAPDLICLDNKEISKDITHYGRWGGWSKGSNQINLNKFLEDKKVDLSDDYWKGYFIHLLTDFYFARKYFIEEIRNAIKNSNTFYNDYYYINNTLINNYHIKKIDKIEKYLECREGIPKYFKIEKVIDFIEKMASIDIDDEVNLIKSGGMEEV